MEDSIFRHTCSRLAAKKIKGKKKNIADHIDFQANPGEFIAFVGGSGAGKSTFMKAISGVVKPTSGSVLINGNELYNNYSVLKNLIGYVPQDNIIYDDLTLYDMLKYAADLRMPDDATKGEKVNRINEVLEIVELSEKKML
jgi:ABC-type multidrug transport system ATPase subunit